MKMQDVELRDYFAGSALAGFLSAPGHIGDEARGSAGRAAAWSYEHADAMLAERAKVQPDAEPTPRWPALPEGLPPVPEGYTYIGMGRRYDNDFPFNGCTSGGRGWTDAYDCEGGVSGLHYACANADLHKITPKVTP